MKTSNCIACGMPFEGSHVNDVGLETADGTVCKFDVADGKMKDSSEIFQGGVEFFSKYTGGDRGLAERVTRTNMKSLPYWVKHHFADLDGPAATNEEFGAVMAKL
jgi:hypothetical protein